MQVDCKLTPTPDGQLTLDGGTFSLSRLCELDGKAAPAGLLRFGATNARIETTDSYYTVVREQALPDKATEPGTLSFQFARRDAIAVRVKLSGQCSEALSFRVNEKTQSWSSPLPLRSRCSDFSLMLPNRDFGKKFQIRVHEGSCTCITDAAWTERILSVQLCKPPARCGAPIPPVNRCEQCKKQCDSKYVEFSKACQNDDCRAPWQQELRTCLNNCKSECE
jgi:hypothetical protein